MKVWVIYDQGTAKIPEDGIFVRPPDLFGVTDGVSGLYIPEKGPRLFDGKSGGRMVSDIIAEAFLSARGEISLEEILLLANERVREIQAPLGFYQDLAKIGFLAGATFAIAKINEGIEIIQCGDCFAVLETREGKVIATRNQVFLHDTKARTIIAELMRKHSGDRNKMWREFRPILTQMRLRDVNQKVKTGYGLLNGQPEVKELWQKITIPREQVKLLLLFTDGLIDYPDSENEQVLAQKVIRLYKQGGLKAILEETRKKEVAEKEVTYIEHGEATAIAVEF